MARSSSGPRRAKSWAAEQSFRPVPRIVRLGRPANDNVRRLGPMTRKLLAILASVLAVLAVVHFSG
jgi:hypothetical protein